MLFCVAVSILSITEYSPYETCIFFEIVLEVLKKEASIKKVLII